MDKLCLDFNSDGKLTMHIDGDVDKFIKAIQNDKLNKNITTKKDEFIMGAEISPIVSEYIISEIYDYIEKGNCYTGNVMGRDSLIITNFNTEENTLYFVEDMINDSYHYKKLRYLKWSYDKETNSFVCLNSKYSKKTVKENIRNVKVKSDTVIFKFLNKYILPEIFIVNFVDEITEYEANCHVNDGTLEHISVSKNIRKIDVRYKDGEVLLCKTIPSVKINVPHGVTKICCDYSTDKFDDDILYDIYIPSSVKNLDHMITVWNGKINSIIFDKDFDCDIITDSGIFCSPFKSVNNLQIPCKISLILSILNVSEGYSHFRYIFDKNSKLKVCYKNKEELLELIKYISSIDKKLIIKSTHKFSFKKNSCVTEKVEFEYYGKKYFYPTYDLKKEVSLKNIDITLCGPELSEKVQNKIKRILKNDNVHFVIDELENTKKQGQIENTEETNETTLLANDIIEEIKSINYFGLDKEKVNGNLKLIVDKYNEDLDNLKNGLSLQSEEGLYTGLLLKLNELKDSLYQKFEKNMGVYDMLDEVNILLSILNGEEVVINSSLESDFYSLSKNILPLVEQKITDDLRNYLESEKQKLVGYLLTGGNIPYEDMDKFILSIRTHLNITLLSIRNYLNKEEILEVIKDYTNMQMQINYKEPIKNYLSVVLLEIDKIKNEILALDENANVDEILNMLKMDFKNIDSYEIINCVNDVFNRLYKLYLELKHQNNIARKRENYKIKL